MSEASSASDYADDDSASVGSHGSDLSFCPSDVSNSSTTPSMRQYAGEEGDSSAGEESAGEEEEGADAGRGLLSGRRRNRKRTKKYRKQGAVRRGCADAAAYEAHYQAHLSPPEPRYVEPSLPPPTLPNSPFTEESAREFITGSWAHWLREKRRLLMDFEELRARMGLPSWLNGLLFRTASPFEPPPLHLLDSEVLREAESAPRGVYLRIYKLIAQIYRDVVNAHSAPDAPGGTKLPERALERKEALDAEWTAAQSQESEPVSAYCQYVGLTDTVTPKERAEQDQERSRLHPEKSFMFKVITAATPAATAGTSEAPSAPVEVVTLVASPPGKPPEHASSEEWGWETMISRAAVGNTLRGGRYVGYHDNVSQDISSPMLSTSVAQHLALVLAGSSATRFPVNVLRSAGSNGPSARALEDTVQQGVNNSALRVSFTLLPFRAPDFAQYRALLSQSIVRERSLLDPLTHLEAEQQQSYDADVRKARQQVLRALHTAPRSQSPVRSEPERAVLYIDSIESYQALRDVSIDLARYGSEIVQSFQCLDLEHEGRICVVAQTRGEYDAAQAEASLPALSHLREVSPAKALLYKFRDGGQAYVVLGLSHGLRPYELNSPRSQVHQVIDGVATAAALAAVSDAIIQRAYKQPEANTPQQAVELRNLLLAIARTRVSALVRSSGRQAFMLIGQVSEPLKYPRVNFLWPGVDSVLVTSYWPSLGFDKKHGTAIRAQVDVEGKIETWGVKFSVVSASSGAKRGKAASKQTACCTLSLARIATAPGLQAVRELLCASGYRSHVEQAKQRAQVYYWLAQTQQIKPVVGTREPLRLLAEAPMRCGVWRHSSYLIFEAGFELVALDQVNEEMISSLPEGARWTPSPLIGRLALPQWMLKNVAELESMLAVGDLEGDVKWSVEQGGISFRVRPAEASEATAWLEVALLSPHVLQIISRLYAKRQLRSVWWGTGATSSELQAFSLGLSTLLVTLAKLDVARLLSPAQLELVYSQLVLSSEELTSCLLQNGPAHLDRWRRLDQYSLNLRNAPAATPSIDPSLELARPLLKLDQAFRFALYFSMDSNGRLISDPIEFGQDVIAAANMEDLVIPSALNYIELAQTKLNLGLSKGDGVARAVLFESMLQPCGIRLSWRLPVGDREAFVPIEYGEALRHSFEVVRAASLSAQARGEIKRATKQSKGVALILLLAICKRSNPKAARAVIAASRQARWRQPRYFFSYEWKDPFKTFDFYTNGSSRSSDDEEMDKDDVEAEDETGAPVPMDEDDESRPELSLDALLQALR